MQIICKNGLKFLATSSASTLTLVALVSSLSVTSSYAAQLEEIVVTARKRSETMQNVPLAVSSVGRDTIEAAFLSNATGIAQFAPNIVFDEISAGTAGGGGISIRGISFQDVEKTFDPTVLIHLDGVPLGTNTGNAMSLLDVERIEVLRGPQGTLFGKNAVGGVINIHRLKPILGEWAGKARVRVGQYEQRDVEGVLNIPLGDTLAVKVNLARLEQDEGYFENDVIGYDEGDNEEKRFGVHFLWKPLDNFQAEFQYNQSDKDGTLPPALNISDSNDTLCGGFGACGYSLGEPTSGDRTEGMGGQVNDFYLDSKDWIVDLNWNITEALTGVLIYGHREDDEFHALDFDGTSDVLFHSYRSSEYEQDSVEVRLDYDDGGRFSITGGYFFWNSEVPSWTNTLEFPHIFGFSDPNACGFGPGKIACQFQSASAESEAHSVFFESDYRLAEKWTMTVGARWIEEEKSLHKRVEEPIFGAVSNPGAGGTRKDDDIIYRLGLRFEPTDDLMAYVTFSTGFRSGGFSIRGATEQVLSTGFKPETVENLEFGIKSTLFDNRLRVNATVFNMDYKDMQQELNIPGGVSGTQQSAVINAAEARLRGAELELTALLSDSLSLDVNAGYLDAEYRDFEGALYADGIVRDNTGLPLRRAPEFNYTVALNHNVRISDGSLTSRISYNWRDDYAGTVTDHPGTHIDSFGLLDASISYAVESWRFAIFGRNLTDEDEYSHTYSPSPQFNGGSFWTMANPRAPRTVGAEVTYTFGNY